MSAENRSRWRVCGLIATLALMSTATGCASPPQRSAAEIFQESVRAYAQRDYQAAATGLEEVVARMPANAEAWFRLGNAYSRTNRPLRAAAAYEQAVLKNTRHGRAWYNLGVTQTRIAANSFLEMSRYLDKDDPLTAVAIEMAQTLLETLNERAQIDGPVAVDSSVDPEPSIVDPNDPEPAIVERPRRESIEPAQRGTEADLGASAASAEVAESESTP